MRPTEPGTLVLPATLDGAAVVAAFRAAKPGAVLDFSAVRELDSSAVALVRALRAEARNVPERYRQLMEAHRMADTILTQPSP
jgi:ABC-type transporter Mla MlaB component